jgi:outer membrane cobalamin receptor
VVEEKEEEPMNRAAQIVVTVLLCIPVVAHFVWAEEPKEEKTVLEEITVTAPRPVNPVTPVDTRYGTQQNVVTQEQIKEQNSYDFQSTLRDVPGVMFQSKNLAGSQTSHSLYIRGRGSSHPSGDFAILFDGVPRFGALFGQVLGDGIPISAIGRIDVYKSPQPSMFGSGYASVNIVPRYMAKEGTEASFNASAGSYGTIDEDLSAGVKKSPFDLFMSQSWLSTDGHRGHSGADQQSYYANAGYRFSNEWDVRVLLNYADAGTDAPKPDVTPTATNGVSYPGAERYETKTLFSTITLNHTYDTFGGYLKAYYNHTDFDLLQELTNGVRYGGNTGGLHSKQEIGLYGIRGKETFHLWQGGEILLGADLDYTDTKNTQKTYTGLVTAGINGGLAQRVWDFPTTRLLSPYLAVSQSIGTKDAFHVTPSAGFRYYDHDQFRDKSAPQAGVVLGYGNTDVNLNYARGVIYPTPVVLMNFVLESAPVANASQYWSTLKPEVVDHYEAGITHRWPDKGSVGATFFRDEGKDRFQAYMFGPVPLVFNDSIGHYELRGLELTGSATPMKNLEFFAGATWLQAQATGQNRITRDHLPYTPSFQFQAGVKWTFLDNFRLFMDMQHLRGLYQGTVARSGTFNIGDTGPANRLPDMTLVNARLGYRFNYKPLRLKDSEVFVSASNIFDESYELAKGYPMPGTTVFAGVSLKFN